MTAVPITWIPATASGDPFPDVRQALRVPDGLLAAGGNLQPELLLTAYRRGIFPWYSGAQPVLWWSPDPRLVLLPGTLRTSRSLRKSLRNRGYQVSVDHAFADVIRHCAVAPRPGETGTWITAEMRSAYCRLAELGHAHSVEVWSMNRLVGGLYGVAIGRAFFGESMFTLQTDASKIALLHLDRLTAAGGYKIIDCQMHTPHLERLGARLLPRDAFVERLGRYCNRRPTDAIRPSPPRPAHEW